MKTFCAWKFTEEKGERRLETGEKVSVKVKEVKPGLELDISPALDKAERTQFHECVRRAFRDELEVRTLT